MSKGSWQIVKFCDTWPEYRHKISANLNFIVVKGSI